MRCSLFALGHPFADDAPHGSELDCLFDFGRSSRSDSLAGGRPEHIFSDDAAFRPASFEGCEIDASFFGDSFCRWRCEYFSSNSRAALIPSLSHGERVTLTRNLAFHLSLWERVRLRA